MSGLDGNSWFVSRIRQLLNVFVSKRVRRVVRNIYLCDFVYLLIGMAVFEYGGLDKGSDGVPIVLFFFAVPLLVCLVVINLRKQRCGQLILLGEYIWLAIYHLLILFVVDYIVLILPYHGSHCEYDQTPWVIAVFSLVIIPLIVIVIVTGIIIGAIIDHINIGK